MSSRDWKDRYIDRECRQNDGQVADMNFLTSFADAVVEDVRECDPVDNFDTIVRLARNWPGFAAQVIVTLAAFVDPDEPVRRRERRVEAISAPPVGGDAADEYWAAVTATDSGLVGLASLSDSERRDWWAATLYPQHGSFARLHGQQRGIVERAVRACGPRVRGGQHVAA